MVAESETKPSFGPDLHGGKVGRWRNGNWHFETVPEAIQDDVVTGDGAGELEEWQGIDLGFGRA